MKITITDAAAVDVALVAIAINDMLRARNITSVTVKVPGVASWEPANRDHVDRHNTDRCLFEAGDAGLQVEIATVNVPSV